MQSVQCLVFPVHAGNFSNTRKISVDSSDKLLAFLLPLKLGIDSPLRVN